MTATTRDTPEQKAGLYEYRIPCWQCQGEGRTTHWLPAGWKGVRDQMVDAGWRRAAASDKTSGSVIERRVALEEAWLDIRRAWEDARELGITQEVCWNWAGLARAQFLKIVNDRTGGK
jgi:hypothetical protein